MPASAACLFSALSHPTLLYSIGLCTSQQLSVQVLCIADINRAGHQLIRGGGAACFMNNPAMWKLFSSIITDTEACQSTCPVEAPKKTRPKHTVKPGMRGHPEKKDAEHQHRRHDVDEGL